MHMAFSHSIVKQIVEIIQAQKPRKSAILLMTLGGSIQAWSSRGLSLEEEEEPPHS